MKRLDKFVRAAEERMEPEADLPALVAHEFAISPGLAGRSVFDDKTRRRKGEHGGQLLLF